MVSNCTNKIFSAIKSCDMFPHVICNTFKNSSQYSTKTGGVISLLIILTFIRVFATTLLRTVNKEKVQFEITNHLQQVPKSISINSSDSLMFAIGMNNHDLVNGLRYFDYHMEYRNFTPTQKIKTSIPLVPCKRQHWDSIGYGETYDQVNMSSWLCPEQGRNFQLEIQGKFISDIFRYYKISVRKCDPKRDPSRPCANDSVIEQHLRRHQGFALSFYYINTIINPCLQTYNGTFLDDQNYFIFSKKFGVQANIYISEYQISTDESLWPWRDHHRQSGAVVLDPAKTTNYEVIEVNDSSEEYLRLYLRKSPIQVEVQRSYRKFDDVFSYLGGLFSILLMAFWFVSVYNQYSYHIDVTRHTYFYDKDQPFDSSFFNILTFFPLVIYQFFKEQGVKFNWPRVEKVSRFLRESRKHLDITLKYEKIQFGQKLAKAVLSQSQYFGLLVSQPYTLQESQKIRQEFKMFRKYRHFIQNLEKGKREEKGPLDFYFRILYQSQISSDQSMSTEEINSNHTFDDRISHNKGKSKTYQLRGQTQQELSNADSDLINKQNQINSKFSRLMNELQRQIGQNKDITLKIWNKIDKGVRQRYWRTPKQLVKSPVKSPVESPVKSGPMPEYLQNLTEMAKSTINQKEMQTAVKEMANQIAMQVVIEKLIQQSTRKIQMKLRQYTSTKKKQTTEQASVQI